MSEKPRIFVNHERTVLVTLWPNGTCEVASRPDSSATWGPPMRMNEEKS